MNGWEEFKNENVSDSSKISDRQMILVQLRFMLFKIDHLTIVLIFKPLPIKIKMIIK